MDHGCRFRRLAHHQGCCAGQFIGCSDLGDAQSIAKKIGGSTQVNQAGQSCQADAGPYGSDSPGTADAYR